LTLNEVVHGDINNTYSWIGLNKTLIKLNLMADELEIIPVTVGNAFKNTEWIDDGYYNES